MPFIVLEGLDGAGKSTQVRLIQHELTARGLEFEYLHFPRFDAPIYGELVARFLRGDLGDVDRVDPYLVALIYAGDRKEAAEIIRGWIAQGKYVIVDRYVYSNIAYQCAKIEDAARREELLEWILNLEYEFNGIPRPDISLFLDVPFEFTVGCLGNNREGNDRDYLKGGCDIHEASLVLQQKVREVYLYLAGRQDDFRIIECYDSGGGMLPPEEIFDKIKRLIFPDEYEI